MHMIVVKLEKLKNSRVRAIRILIKVLNRLVWSAGKANVTA